MRSGNVFQVPEDVKPRINVSLRTNAYMCVLKPRMNIS